MRARGGIVIVIAHRPNALAALDQILVMANGKQMSFGPKDEILGEFLKAAAPAQGGDAQAGAIGGVRERRMNGDRKTPAHPFDRPAPAVAAVAIGAARIRGRRLGADHRTGGCGAGVGTVVVDGNVKAVQHPLGGVVEEIAVRNGQHGAAGRRRPAPRRRRRRADLALVDTALDALFVRRARLEAERDGRAELGPVAGAGAADWASRPSPR